MFPQFHSGDFFLKDAKGCDRPIEELSTFTFTIQPKNQFWGLNWITNEFRQHFIPILTSHILDHLTKIIGTWWKYFTTIHSWSSDCYLFRSLQNSLNGKQYNDTIICQIDWIKKKNNNKNQNLYESDMILLLITQVQPF